jgi:NAD(P)H-dependent FMN reductase
MEHTHNLLIIVGSVREGRFGPVVASWVADQARSHGGFEVGILDLADVELPWPCPPLRRSMPAPRTRARPG